MCLCIRCLSGKGELGEGKKKNLPDLLTEQYFQKYTKKKKKKKKTRGKKQQTPKKQKNNPPAYILSLLLLLKPRRHPFVENKPERGHDTNSSVANLFIESGDSNGMREIRGNHMRKTHKSLRREEPVFPS